MATKVMMEALSPTMEEGRLVKWVKAVGDAVKSGDTIAEVETDKAIMELVARGDGVMRAQLIAEGETSPIGQTIGVIAAADEDISGIAGGSAAPASPATAAASAETAAAAQSENSSRREKENAENAEASTGATRSSPLARRLAAEKGLNLSSIQGSGPGGRIIKRDIEAASSAPPAASIPLREQSTQVAATASAPSSASKPTSVTPSIQIDGEYKDVTLTQMRKTIARRLGESIGPIPTFFLTSEIDMTNVGKLREQMSAAGDQFKVSVNDIIIKAVAIALTRHPEVNAHWMGDHIRYFSAAHIGMAVATDDGLIVPVIRDAHLKGLGAIGKEARELAKRARERKLQPAEFSGGTFSVSNLGMFGIDQFTAIINPPEAAILAVGATETKPVWENGQFVPRQRMRVTMSCDHRIIDGAVGARFLQTLKLLLESPLMMLF